MQHTRLGHFKYIKREDLSHIPRIEVLVKHSTAPECVLSTQTNQKRQSNLCATAAQTPQTSGRWYISVRIAQNLTQTPQGPHRPTRRLFPPRATYEHKQRTPQTLTCATFQELRLWLNLTHPMNAYYQK